MSTQNTTGPWKPELHRGYSTSYWVLERENSTWMFGRQKMTGKGGSLCRWKSEAAARKAADAENAKATDKSADTKGGTNGGPVAQ